jgi:hypothetical protein
LSWKSQGRLMVIFSLTTITQFKYKVAGRMFRRVY